MMRPTVADSMARSDSGSRPGAEAWNASLAAMADATVLQTYQWGELKAAFGWRPLRVESEAGMAQVLLRRTPVGVIAYVPRGPALPAGDRRAHLGRLLEPVHAACRAAGAFALKLEPPWRDDAARRDDLAELGFRPSGQTVQPPSTAIVALDGSEDAILGRMRPKTRYNVRLAAKKGVTVRQGTAADLGAFGALMAQTGSRDGFAVHPTAYYERAHALFAPAGLAALLLAEHDGALLAGLMAFAFGDTAYYLFGASSDEQRNLMPTYALQWEAMRWARASGCRYYDLWGIPDEVGRDPAPYMEDDPPARQGLWGVWRFKRGFGGEVVRHVGAWDFVYRPLAYRLYGLLLRLRRRALAG
jgi:peptidoglycan pentaglycine glycine transferase (the first glycine)